MIQIVVDPDKMWTEQYGRGALVSIALLFGQATLLVALPDKTLVTVSFPLKTFSKAVAKSVVFEGRSKRRYNPRPAKRFAQLKPKKGG